MDICSSGVRNDSHNHAATTVLRALSIIVHILSVYLFIIWLTKKSCLDIKYIMEWMTFRWGLMLIWFFKYLDILSMESMLTITIEFSDITHKIPMKFLLYIKDKCAFILNFHLACYHHIQTFNRSIFWRWKIKKKWKSLICAVS